MVRARSSSMQTLLLLRECGKSDASVCGVCASQQSAAADGYHSDRVGSLLVMRAPCDGKRAVLVSLRFLGSPPLLSCVDTRRSFGSRYACSVSACGAASVSSSDLLPARHVVIRSVPSCDRGAGKTNPYDNRAVLTPPTRSDFVVLGGGYDNVYARLVCCLNGASLCARIYASASPVRCVLPWSCLRRSVSCRVRLPLSSHALSLGAFWLGALGTQL